MDFFFFSILNIVVFLRLRKVKENSLILWYNEYIRILKRVVRKMERSWRKIKLEVFRIVWRESSIFYRKVLKIVRFDYFFFFLEENKYNFRYLFNIVVKLMKNKVLISVDIF